MSDKLLDTLLVVVYTAVLVCATIFGVRVYDLLKGKRLAHEAAAKQSMQGIARYRLTLDLMSADPDTAMRDSALMEYAASATQYMEELLLLSPFPAVRDSAASVQARFFDLFPTLRASTRKPEFKNGDLIVRHSDYLHSEFIRKLNSREQVFSHLGVIRRTSDSLTVLHATAGDLTGIGGIEAVPLSLFMPQGDFDVAVYRLQTPQSVRDALADDILRLRAKGTPFDPFFNVADTTRLYCAELVAYSVNRVLEREAVQPSGVFMGKPIYTVDDCYLIPEMECVYRFGASKH